VEAWQRLPPKQQQKATLITAFAVSIPETVAPKASYHGRGIGELVALLGKS
jgi:hypothetical protein